jgi:hypothetical protein
MAGAPAQEEIDETIGKGLRPQDDIANLQFELLMQCSRAGQVSAVTCRKPSNCNRGGDGRATGPAKASSLSERDRSHWSPLRLESELLPFTSQPVFLDQPENLSFLGSDLESRIELESSVLFQHFGTARPADDLVSH